MSTEGQIRGALEEAVDVLAATLANDAFQDAADRFVDLAHTTLEAGGTLYSCGNGGSMCDAMHFAEEWTGRFRADRRALPAVSFSDPSHLTCIANDFGYDQVFARMVEALARPGDLLVVLTTSGNSPNIVAACEAARARDVRVVGLLGKGGGPVRELCDAALVVPLATTSDRIQEIHIKVLHAVIEAVERRLFPANYA
jgi:D-sedoheptulose 7-phosphate isomerase